MSDRKTFLIDIEGLWSRMNPLIPQVKDGAILFGWIASIILVAGLCWFFTQPLRSRLLLNAVNRVLVQSGDSRRLGEPIPQAALAGRSRMGSWYTLGERRPGNALDGNRALIFTFIGEGTFFPCVAMVLPGGKVEEFIPLGSHGEKMLKRVSPEVLKIYARRIEGPNR